MAPADQYVVRRLRANAAFFRTSGDFSLRRRISAERALVEQEVKCSQNNNTNAPFAAIPGLRLMEARCSTERLPNR
jgi:hypothetical protein